MSEKFSISSLDLLKASKDAVDSFYAGIEKYQEVIVNPNEYQSAVDFFKCTKPRVSTFTQRVIADMVPNPLQALGTPTTVIGSSLYRNKE